MNQADALEITQSAIWTIIIASSPAVAAAMIVGVVIATLQAVTQIQEMTLTFIPKIVTILIVCAITGVFMGSQIFAFTNEVYGRIASGF
jgi:flagellar biosynthetic protein FliQ